MGLLRDDRFRWLLALVIGVLITGHFHSGRKANGVIWSDQEGYYIYLPAVFIHGGFGTVPCVNGCTQVRNGDVTSVFTKYTYGVALMESPFFLVAHAVAPWFGQPQDGRSLPYVWSILLAAVCYMLAGLFLLSKLLRELKFGQTIVWLVPLGLLLGTNLFHYTFREAGMSHVYSFFLFSILIYGAHRRSVSGGLSWDLLTATPMALIILVRPTNAIALLIPMLWGTDLRSVPIRLKNFFTDVRWMFIFLVALAVLFAPQLAYWKAITGNYIFYSYGDEGFIHWNRPKMFQVLFSPQNGWLVYSPIVAMGFLGLMAMMREKKDGWLLPVALLSLATYIFGSWWAWWFGGAFGHRCFVELLPVLAVPAAFAINWVSRSATWLRYGFSVAGLLAVVVNIRMSIIYQGMWDGPDWGWADYFHKLANVFFL